MPIHTLNSVSFDRTAVSCFPLNVIALVPYMMYHYDNHHTECINAAVAITKICLDGSSTLANLGNFGRGKVTQ